MSCPTCSHTMQSVGKLEAGDILYWCPRCGTIRRKPYAHNDYERTLANHTDESPTLPGRFKELFYHLPPDLQETARRLGVVEASFTEFATGFSRP